MVLDCCNLDLWKRGMLLLVFRKIKAMIYYQFGMFVFVFLMQFSHLHGDVCVSSGKKMKRRGERRLAFRSPRANGYFHPEGTHTLGVITRNTFLIDR